MMKKEGLSSLTREFRATHGLTQARLAALLEVSIPTIQRIEAGGSCPAGNLLPLALVALEAELTADARKQKPPAAQ